MLSDRATALSLILAHEGGKVDHPKDPGGRTNRGITQRVYDGFRGARELPKRDVWLIDKDEIDAVYNLQYLNLVWYDRLPLGLNYAVADYAVNSGPGRAIKDLQRTIRAMPGGKKIAADGTMGNMTLSAVLEIDAAGETAALIENYVARRMAFLRSLRTWATFGVGWKRRVVGKKEGAQPGQDNGVLDYALAMVNAGERVLSQPMTIGAFEGEVVAAKALPEDLATMKTSEGIGTIGASATGILVVLNQVRDELTPLVDAPMLGESVQIVIAVLGLVSTGLLVYSAMRNLTMKRAS